MIQNNSYRWKLGLFVILGLVLTTAAIYFIGKNKNMFGDTFQLKSHFKNVSGLKVGNNVRFSGINIGTVKAIDFVSDTSVVVVFIVKGEVRQYLKKDAIASIGSDGLMGDKVLTLSPVNKSEVIVKDNDILTSTNAIEMEDILQSIKVSVDNAQVITYQLAEFTAKMNNKNSILSKLVNDDKMGMSLDATLRNINSASKGLDENMEAAKHNFLLRGYFRKKEKAEAKRLKLIEKEKQKKNKK